MRQSNSQNGKEKCFLLLVACCLLVACSRFKGRGVWYYTYYIICTLLHPSPLRSRLQATSLPQASNKQASTSPFHFGRNTFPTLRALVYSSHPKG